MGGAIFDEGGVAGVVAARAVGEGEVGGAEIGTVEDDEVVVVKELHVHGGDADAFVEETPLAGG